MAIFVTGKEDPLHPPKDIKIVIKGTQVLNDVPSVAPAVAMLFGLTYALNLNIRKICSIPLNLCKKFRWSLVEKRCPQKFIG